MQSLQASMMSSGACDGCILHRPCLLSPRVLSARRWIPVCARPHAPGRAKRKIFTPSSIAQDPLVQLPSPPEQREKIPIHMRDLVRCWELCMRGIWTATASLLAAASCMTVVDPSSCRTCSFPSKPCCCTRTSAGVGPPSAFGRANWNMTVWGQCRSAVLDCFQERSGLPRSRVVT